MHLYIDAKWDRGILIRTKHASVEQRNDARWVEFGHIRHTLLELRMVKDLAVVVGQQTQQCKDASGE